MLLNIVVAFSFILIIIFIVFITKKKIYNLDKVLLFDTSLFFDDMFKKDCIITFKYFNNYLSTIKKLLYKYKKYNPKIIVMNRITSISYELNGKYKICTDYNYFCEDSQYLWASVNVKFGKLLHRNNLVKSYNENGNLFLFKTYKCDNNELLIIGLVLR